MYRVFASVFLILLGSCFNFVQAQSPEIWSYEVVYFPDGESEEYYLYYDEFYDWIYFINELGEERYFTAEDVLSFEYRGARYYSLPFQNGSLSFFKVEFEGSKIAFLSKAGSLNLIHYLAQRFEKEYTLCNRGSRSDEINLCEIEIRIGGYATGYGLLFMPSGAGSQERLFNHPEPMISPQNPLLSRKVKPVDLQGGIFVLTEAGLKLHRIEVEKKTFGGLRTARKNRLIQPLEEMFERGDYSKIQSYAKENKLKEKEIRDLVAIFQYYDGLQ